MNKLAANKHCLVVHIGTGKTGSTSIQRFLADNVERLEGFGIKYWGLNFEHINFGTSNVDWLGQKGLVPFQQMDDETARSQLKLVLLDALNSLKKSSSSIAIWSFEGIYNRPQVYLTALLDAASNASVDLRVIAFARNHIDYAKSAYKQWGVCHKHYEGPVLGFDQWFSRYKQTLCFAAKLADWKKSLGELFYLVDYDNCKDVVEEFILQALSPLLPSLDCGQILCYAEQYRYNQKPDDSIFLLHALFNHYQYEPTVPAQFKDWLGHFPLLDRYSSFPSWASIIPSIEMISGACEEICEDQHLLHRLLNNKTINQLLEASKLNHEHSSVAMATHYEKILSLFFAILLDQQSKIIEIREKLTSLRQKFLET